MISTRTLQTLRFLVQHESLSVREASRRLGISRNTAARWLSVPQGVEPCYPLRPISPGLLDPYKEHLVIWLQAGLHCGERQRSSVCTYLECLRIIGFPGSKSLVYDYCRTWKLQLNSVVPTATAVVFACDREGLTAREWEVLTWIGKGLSCREIAATLSIAIPTVRKHRCNILGKFDLHSTAQLVSFAITRLLQRGDTQDQMALSRLTASQREVVGCLAKGLTSKEIARSLKISPATVRKHRENAMKCVQVNRMAALMWHAVETPAAIQAGSPAKIPVVSAIAPL